MLSVSMTDRLKLLQKPIFFSLINEYTLIKPVLWSPGIFPIYNAVNTFKYEAEDINTIHGTVYCW